MERVYPDCGASESDKPFYPTSTYCADCHNKRIVSDRKQPHRRPKVNAYNNQWLKQHRKANRDAQRRWRERHRVERTPVVIPPERQTVRQAMARLGLQSRFRITQLIDEGRLKAEKDEYGRWLIEQLSLELLIAERVRDSAT